MSEPTPHSLSRFFSALTGRPIHVSLAVDPPAPKGAQMFGLYAVVPGEGSMVVRAGVTTLALFSGALLGLPDDIAIERARATPLDEPLRDAMHEVMNIASTAIRSDARVVFRTMSRDLDALPAEAARTVQQAARRNHYRVAVDGEHTELFTVFG